MSRKRNSKKKSPSREKYDKENPTVSSRIPIEKRTKLLSVLRRLGTSLRDLLISLADELEVKAKSLEEARLEGYELGYRDAAKRFMVTFACAMCKRRLAITSPQAKDVAGKFMSQQGWRHRKYPIR